MVSAQVPQLNNFLVIAQQSVDLEGHQGEQCADHNNKQQYNNQRLELIFFSYYGQDVYVTSKVYL